MHAFRWFAAVGPLLGLGFWTTADHAPSTTRYRIESKLDQTVDLSAFQQPNQVSSTSQLAIVTVTTTDTTGGRVLHVVIDSVATDAPLPGAAEAAKSAKGAWIHGVVDGWGRTTIVKTSADSNEIVAQIKASFQRFFPIMKPNAKAGESWIDTTNVESKTPLQAIRSTTVATYTLGGSAAYEGTQATQIDAVASTTGVGTAENPAMGTMEISLTDNSTEAFFVAQDGRYLGGTAKSTIKSLVRVAVAPDPIPVTATRTTTVSVVK